MSKKGVLISDPSLREMNDTQWLFEAESLYAAEERRYEDWTSIVKLVRRGVVSMLGLDLMPLEVKGEPGPDGEPSISYRQATDDEIIPLAVMVGREEVLSEIFKRHEAMSLQEKVDQDLTDGKVMTPEELEEFMAADVPEFLDNPEDLKKFLVWKDPMTKLVSEKMVRPISEMNKVYEEGKPHSRRRGRVVVE